MSLLLVILLILLLFGGGFGYWGTNGGYGPGSWVPFGGVVLLLIIVLLTGRLS